MPHFQRDIGSHIKVIKGFEPEADDGAAAQPGDTIDRHLYGTPESCVLHANAGAATGSPTAQTLDVKIQHSDDGTSWADLTGAAITQITADDAEAEKDVDLTTAKRYIRTHRTVALTGGTSPTWPVSEILILGGPSLTPQ